MTKSQGLAVKWSPEDRALVLALRGEGHTIPAIAERIGRPEQAVKGVIRRARPRQTPRRAYQTPAARFNDDGAHLCQVFGARDRGFPAWDLPAAYRVAA